MNNFYVVYFKVERSGEGGDAMDYWYYRSHDDNPGMNSYVYILCICILSCNPNRFHLLDSDNRKINSFKGNEHGNQDTHTDVAGEEDASDEEDSRSDDTNQNSVDDSLEGDHGNDHIHNHIQHDGNDHGKKEDDGTHLATEGTNVDKRGKMVWNNVEDIEQDALQSYDDDSYYDTHELDEHQETQEYSEESREGKEV